MDGKIPKTVSAALCVLFVLSCIFAVILVLPSYSKYVKMQKKVSALEQNREKIHG